MKKIKFPEKLLGLRASAIVEIAAFFFFAFLIAMLLDQKSNFFSVSPHPYWIIVILIAAQYGTNEALIAAGVSSIILLLGPLPPQTVLQDRFEYLLYLVKNPLLWFVAAAILGELRLKHIRERDKLKKIAEEAEEEKKKIAESYAALKNIKERLEMHIVSEMSTTLMAITAFKELEEPSKEGIIKGAVDLTRTLIAPEKFSIFLLESGKLKKKASEGWEETDHYLESLDASSPLYQEIADEGRVVSMTTDPEILGDEGVLAAPIIDEKEEIHGMIKVEQIPFLRLRTTTIESLRTLGEWVGSALAKEEAKEKRHVRRK